MTRPILFLWHFFLALTLLSSGILGFVTWMDPFRNLNCPWATSFISDRNMGYKRFKTLETATSVTDLVVGSSTSEVFVPHVLKNLYGGEPFMASTGGASLPVRYVMIQKALKTHPELRRVIYVADLFEFRDLEVTSEFYYQPEMVSFLVDEEKSRLLPPSNEARFGDFFSYLLIDRSIRTFKDILQQRRGTYSSSVHADGSTTASMVVHPNKLYFSIHDAALTTAWGMEPIYGTLHALHPDARWMFHRLIRLIENAPKVKLDLVIAPFHPIFYEQFKERFERSGIYAAWLRELQSYDKSAGGRIRVHDFSTVPGDLKYWHDGVHFSSQAMHLMAQKIYSP